MFNWRRAMSDKVILNSPVHFPNPRTGRPDMDVLPLPVFLATNLEVQCEDNKLSISISRII